MRLLERYVLREHLLPFLLGFSVVTAVLVLDFLFDYLDLIVTKGIPALVVFKLFLLALGWITALSVPCGVLVAALMTFGRMAQDNELTAIRSCGINLGRLLFPVLLAAAGVALLLTLFNNYILPNTNHAFANLSIAIHRKSPTAVIRAGVFNNDFPDKSVIVGEVNDRTGDLTEVTIYDFARAVPTTILARTGRMAYSPDGTTLGSTQGWRDPRGARRGDARKYRRLQFKTHTILMRNMDAALQMPEGAGRAEMNITQLRREMNLLETSYGEKELRLRRDLDSLGFSDYAAFARRTLPKPRGLTGLVAGAQWALQGLGGVRPDTTRAFLNDGDQQRLVLSRMELDTLHKRINSYGVVVQKKFSIPFACVIFVLLGAPLGMKARRGGVTTSAISVVFFIIYYLFLIGGEQLADRNILTPAVAMWSPNVILGLPGLWLTWQALRGGEERR
jgi:lipopolysaccharide export system permease protein